MDAAGRNTFDEDDGALLLAPQPFMRSPEPSDFAALRRTLQAGLDRVQHRLDGLDAQLGILLAEREANRLEPPSMDSSHGLFVVGHARSGTTVLMEALNSSPDVHLFSEAGLYESAFVPDFRSRFNADKARFGNERNKGTYCPGLAPEKGCALDHLVLLSKTYRWFGEKVALGVGMKGDLRDQFTDFHARHFYDSRYVCVVRHPLSTIFSSKTMFSSNSVGDFVRSYLTATLLVLDMFRLFPHVKILKHEQVDSSTFDRLALWLGTPLPHAQFCYAREKQQMPPADLPDFLTPTQFSLLSRAWTGFEQLYDERRLVLAEQPSALAELQRDIRLGLERLSAEA